MPVLSTRRPDHSQFSSGGAPTNKQPMIMIMMIRVLLPE
jgi:hypothetical protein